MSKGIFFEVHKGAVITSNDILGISSLFPNSGHLGSAILNFSISSNLQRATKLTNFTDVAMKSTLIFIIFKFI